MKRIVIAVSVGIALLVGGGLAYAALDTSTPEKAAQACFDHHGFGAEPVDVAKTSDGAEVLAQVSWGANDLGWCYLALDGSTTTVLRDYASGSLVYPTPTPAPTPSAAEQTIIDNYPTFYNCATTGRTDCQHPAPTPTPDPTPSAAEQTIIDNYPTFYNCATTGRTDCQHPAPAPIQKFGNWQFAEGENVNGSFRGYLLAATTHSGFDWEDPPLLILRCHEPLSGTGANDGMFVTTPWLLHGADNTAGVAYRFTGETVPTENIWYSDEELDSVVAPTSSAQRAEFLRRLRTADGRLFMSFESLYSGETDQAQFDVRGAADVLEDLGCF